MTQLWPRDDVLLQEISTLYSTRIRDAHAPGAYFALFGVDGIEGDGGFGHVRPGGAAPTCDSAFRIASCTKSFTAATLLLLRDRGLLHLDAPITDFVPSFHAQSHGEETATPTVRMLMTMSGGLATDDPWADRQESISRKQLDLLAASVHLASVPGTRFEYSNLGYALLGRVIETVTGRTYIDVVTTELIQPLQLASTGFESTVVSLARLASGHRRRGENWVELPFSGPGAFSPIGGIFSTGTDLARWARWLGSALRSDGAEPGPLAASSRREMQQIQRAIPGGGEQGGSYGYGFGLFVQEHASGGITAFHSGGYPGFSAHMRWNQAAALGIVSFENATYSGSKKPATAALELAVERADRRMVAHEAWPDTRKLQAQATELVRSWRNALANEIFAENAALDLPLDERAIGIQSEIDRVGGLQADARPQTSTATGETPAHRVWFLPAARGRLRCEILVTPTIPARIQTLLVTGVLD
ncbi:serine hydrolase domain-containing protein [Cryobacterium aureum]|uniref:serine hydrolase domain-containing protein n=1 Tax=Cryobacterium aureum TaxID=995037 RepID=UPI0013752C5E|nr:serine hydrolase domain-containing protein [Cryobacterium aureum]